MSEADPQRGARKVAHSPCGEDVWNRRPTSGPAHPPIRPLSGTASSVAYCRFSRASTGLGEVLLPVVLCVSSRLAKRWPWILSGCPGRRHHTCRDGVPGGGSARWCEHRTATVGPRSTDGVGTYSRRKQVVLLIAKLHAGDDQLVAGPHGVSGRDELSADSRPEIVDSQVDGSEVG